MKHIKNAYLLQVNDTPISNIDKSTTILNQCQSHKVSSIVIIVDNDHCQSLHHEEGVLLLYFNQLNMINNHLHEICLDQEQLSEAKSQESLKINKLMKQKGILPKNKCRSEVGLHCKGINVMS